MAEQKHDHDKPQAAACAASLDRYDTLDDGQFHEISDKVLRLLSLSTDGTWPGDGYPVVGRYDVVEDAFANLMQSLRLTKHGIYILNELLGSPIFDQEYIDRMQEDDVFLMANGWAYEIKPYHFATIWRTFVDLRDGKIDHATAMSRAEATRERIRGLIAQWGDIYDMIEEKGSLDEVVGWAKQHDIDEAPASNSPEDEFNYRQSMLQEFAENLYPGAADLPDDELAAFMARVAQHPIRMTDNQRAIIGLLFYSGTRGRTVCELADRTNMTYSGTVTLLRKLQTFGLIEKIDAPKVTYTPVRR